MGRAAYEDGGRMLSKLNTYTDFISCAEHCIAQGITEPSRLAICGRSAGGTLMGAVLNMRPDLFAAAVADVPFVDVLNTMVSYLVQCASSIVVTSTQSRYSSVLVCASVCCMRVVICCSHSSSSSASSLCSLYAASQAVSIVHAVSSKSVYYQQQ
jgi:Prolyl oligopeptidase family